MTPQLSPEDEALLQWSGELDGSPPPELQHELDPLAAAVGRLPEPDVPAGALQAALQRHRQETRFPARPVLRRILLPAAAAVAVLVLAVSLLTGPGRSPEAPASTAKTDAPPAAKAFPSNVIRLRVSDNLKRIRGARARILKTKSRFRRSPAPDESAGAPASPSPRLS